MKVKCTLPHNKKWSITRRNVFNTKVFIARELFDGPLSGSQTLN